MKKQINPTTKAQILRGAFYLLLLLAICAVSFALAQSRGRGTTEPLSRTIPVSNPASDASGVTHAARASTGKVGASAAGLPATSNVAAQTPAIAGRINPPMPQAPNGFVLTTS
jgi:hypothetical protein